LQYGGDLRWNTPLRGLLIGASRLDQDTQGKGTSVSPLDPAGPRIPYSEKSKSDWMNQYYGSYVVKHLRIDSEYRRYVRDQLIFGGVGENLTDVRGWYIAGSYRINRRFAFGAYYSRYTIESFNGGLIAAFGNQTDTALPANHIYDKVVSASFNATKFLNFKAEMHFMDGYGSSTYPDGFYPQENPQGFAPETTAVVVKTSVYF
jgi:hypothetical protein